MQHSRAQILHHQDSRFKIQILSCKQSHSQDLFLIEGTPPQYVFSVLFELLVSNTPL